jgi:hypothetical protein
MPVRVPPRRSTQQPHISADPPFVWHTRPGAAGQSQVLVADTSRAVGTGTTSASVTVTCPTSTLVVAFVSWDKAVNVAGVAVMSGGGLAWSTGIQANTVSATVGGGAEIYTAYAAAGLAAQSLTATVSASTATALTIVTFRGAAAYQHGAGARQDNSAAGLFSASVINQIDQSWVWAIVYNYDNSTSGTPGAGQTIQKTYTDGGGDAGWVQSTTAPSSGVGNTVTLNDSAPSVHGHLAVLEIIPDFAMWEPSTITQYGSFF